MSEGPPGRPGAETGARPPGAERRPLLVTMTGPHRAGTVAAVMDAVASTGAELLDVQELVVRGHVLLSLALAPVEETGDAVSSTLAAAARSLSLTVTTTTDLPAPPAPDGGPVRARLHVTVLARGLGAGQLAAMASEVNAAGAGVERVRHLSLVPVSAVEMDVVDAEPVALRRALAARAAQVGVDVAVSPAGLARHGRRLVVLDVDSTLVRDEVIELIAARAGRGEEVAALTAAAMRGEVDFAESLRRRVSALAGLHVSVLDDVRADVRLTPGAKTLVDVLHHLGYTVAVVSGGFVEVVAPLAASLGITRVRANALEVSSGLLTGRTVGPVVDRAGKAAALRAFAAAERLPLSRTVAVGDGANDLDMLAAAGLGIAFNATPVVRAAAHTSISTPYLDSVLLLLGISRAEIDEIASMTGAPGTEATTLAGRSRVERR